MHFEEDEFYHVYNRGNNKQLIFFSEGNFEYFLKKIEVQILPLADLISYCLMSNHFHLILRANDEGLKLRSAFGGKPMQQLPFQLGKLLSSYAQAINKQNQTIGSLFQQKTRAKALSENTNGIYTSYFEQCFHYIHQNPLRAGMVSKAEDWPYSSYSDYIGLRDVSLCKKEVFFNQTRLSINQIIERTSMDLDSDILSKILE